MPQQLTKLSDKDFKLLKKERTGLLGENGPFFPTFGNHIDDFVKFYVYDLNDTYLKYGISEDFQNTPREDILTLKGFGEKTVDKVSAIIIEAVADRQAELKKKKEEEDVETDSTIEPVLDEVEND